MSARIKIRSVSDGRRMGVGPHSGASTKQNVVRIKIRSVSDGGRMGVGPHAD